MADILSQEEVDALLTAVSEGELDVDTPDEPVERVHVTQYDFKRPERISKEEIRGFQTLSELLARDLSTAFGASLRAVARVSVVSVDQITYDEYVISISNPTSYNIIQIPPLEGNIILEFSPFLIFPIIDRMLGGRGMAISEARELTEIEQKLTIKIIEIVLNTLIRAWRHVEEFSWKLLAQENDPQIVQIVAGSEIVLALRFELHVGDIGGTMSFCIPAIVIEPVLENVGAEYTFYGSRPQFQDPLITGKLAEIISRSKATVEASMVGSVISVNDLLKLQVGDIVRLDNSVADESSITVNVCGKPKFKAKQGRIGNKQAIQIISKHE
jgi:flagellar motor switch protein FliM